MWKRPFLIYAATFLFLVLVIAWHFLIGPSENHGGEFFNRNENALWIRHSWVDTDQSWEAISELVHSLETHGITYVYVHAGPINDDGDVPDYRYIYARQFLDRARAINPKIKYLAWLGQQRSKIDLDSAEIRKKIVGVAATMVGDIGFDGIHYDFESINQYDDGFVQLARETDPVLGSGILSVAFEEYIPPLFAWGLSYFVDIHDSLSKELLLDLAPVIDQFVIMGYDTKVDDPKIYTWLIKQEIIAITRLLPNSNIYMGVPTYDDQRPSFNPEAENISTSLTGIIQGLNSLRSKREAFKGVSIYANWETDESEWKIYEQLWQGKK